MTSNRSRRAIGVTAVGLALLALPSCAAHAQDGLARLRGATVAVFGLGAVGSYVVEALARAGVGSLVLFDHDTVGLSNINRQLFALHSTVGRHKAEALAEVLHAPGHGRQADPPASRVRPSDGRLEWLVDREAAGRVQDPGLIA